MKKLIATTLDTGDIQWLGNAGLLLEEALSE